MDTLPGSGPKLRAFRIPRSAIAHDKTSQRLVLGLLFLKLLASVGLSKIFPAPVWRAGLLVSYTFCTYLLVALLIWWERQRLSEFRIGKLAVTFFILGPAYQLLITAHGFAYAPFPLALATLPISIGLLVALGRADRRLIKNPAHIWRWVLIGIFVGAVIGVFSGYLLAIQTGRRPTELALWDLALLPALQIANAAAQEEPLFRGFLWGWLLKKGWKEVWIWLFQAGLFWLGHLYYLGVAPLSYWVIVPLGGLVFGLVAWRARDIAPSMLCHGFGNGIGQIVGGA